jgi:hypothetical protein
MSSPVSQIRDHSQLITSFFLFSGPPSDAPIPGGSPNLQLPLRHRGHWLRHLRVARLQEEPGSGDSRLRLQLAGRAAGVQNVLGEVARLHGQCLQQRERRCVSRVFGIFAKLTASHRNTLWQHHIICQKES